MKKDIETNPNRSLNVDWTKCNENVAIKPELDFKIDHAQSIVMVRTVCACACKWFYLFKSLNVDHEVWFTVKILDTNKFNRFGTCISSSAVGMESCSCFLEKPNAYSIIRLHNVCMNCNLFIHHPINARWWSDTGYSAMCAVLSKNNRNMQITSKWM